MSEFTPIQRLDGYLPLEDYGLIGDGTTAALVGRDGTLAWLRLPRFDSPPVFCHLLDTRRGGVFTVAPDDVVESRQFYEPDSGVLVTEMRSRSGLLRLADALTLRSGADLAEDTPAGRGELLRSVRVLDGRVRLQIELLPRGGARAEPSGGGVDLRCSARPDLDLHLTSTMPLAGLHTSHHLEAGAAVHVLLRWGGGSNRYHPITPDELLSSTLAAWRHWMQHLQYEGPQKSLVRRAAMTLKLLDYFENGAIVAAPTSSLPEAIGGPRNWDYRYAWIRDAAFSVYALRRIGLTQEASGFLAWVLDAVERGGQPRVLYDLDGHHPPPEREDPELEGYRRSRPVRWGNAAADQRQHDVYGEILDCAYQWAVGGGGLDASLLTLPLRRVLPADHHQMVATTKAITACLGAGNGLLYRYLPEISPDGLPGHEGAFLLCSFWLVDNLAGQGRLDEAMELYDSLCARAGPLGLLPEQIDPSSGAFLGNYPQAFSHVGLISSGVNLARVIRNVGGRGVPRDD
jgi:GH15 family glucan-1,4-alpha-glucosidase